MIQKTLEFAPFMGVLTGVLVFLWAAHWLLIGRKKNLGDERLFPRQLTMLGLTLVGLLVVVLALPINESSRNQLIALIGIVISGTLAFSSTTILSNLMSGMLLRITKPFRVGDFVRIGEHFGRVSERGLFDTEIQTERRELVSLPNSFCFSNPVSATPSDGTIISASLSLGYENDHKRIEKLLAEAANACGLKDTFVHILELGNFAVTYRVSGLLEESKRLISARSNLYGSVLDTLHEQDIEIMSPSFMNQRRLAEGEQILPRATIVSEPEVPTVSAEEVAFDKAEKAEEIENEKDRIKEEIEALEVAVKDSSNEDAIAKNKALIEEKREQLTSLEEVPDPPK